MYPGQRRIEKEFPRYLRPISILAEQVTWKENSSVKKNWSILGALIGVSVLFIALTGYLFSVGNMVATLTLIPTVLFVTFIFFQLPSVISLPSAIGYGRMALYFRYGKSKVDIWLWTEISDLAVKSTRIHYSGRHSHDEIHDMLHLIDNLGQDWTFDISVEPPTELSSWVIEAKRGWRITL